MFWRTSNYIGLKGVNESESSYANVAFFQLDEEFQNGSLAFDEVQQILYFNIGPKLLYLDFTHFIQPYLYHMRAVSYHALPEDIVDLAIDPTVQLLVVITESRICQLSVALNATNCQVASLGEKLMAVETVPENEYYLFVKVNLQGGSYNLSVVSTAYNNSWTTTTPIQCSTQWQLQSFAGVILGNGGSRGKQAALVFLILWPPKGYIAVKINSQHTVCEYEVTKTGAWSLVGRHSLNLAGEIIDLEYNDGQLFVATSDEYALF